MFLSKKETPATYMPMYYAMLLNLSMTYINILTGSPFLACITLGAACYLLYRIKILVQKEVWNKLSGVNTNVYTNWYVK